MPQAATGNAPAQRNAAELSDREIRQLLAAGQRITQPLRALAAADPGTPGFVAVLDDPGGFCRLGRLAAALLGRTAGLAAAQSLGTKTQIVGGQTLHRAGFAAAAHHTFDFLAAGLFGFLLQGFNLLDDLCVGFGHEGVLSLAIPVEPECPADWRLMKNSMRHSRCIMNAVARRQSRHFPSEMDLI